MSHLLEVVEGRDKLYKLLMGILLVIEGVTQSKQAIYLNTAVRLSEVRAFLRLGHVVESFMKLSSLMNLFSAQGLAFTEKKKFVEFAKTVCEIIYVFADNVVVLSRQGLLGSRISADSVWRYDRVVRFWYYLFGTVFHLIELRDGIRRLEYDPPAAKRACRLEAAATVSDAVDVLLSISLLRQLRDGRHLGFTSTGLLVSLSGALSSYLVWEKTS